jgi:integrase
VRIYKRGGKQYWFELVFEGIRYQRSTKHTNKVQAEGAAAAFRTALANRNFGIVKHRPAPIFEDAMRSFLAFAKSEHKEHPATWRRYKTSSKSLLGYSQFKQKRLDQITPKIIEDYKEYRGGQKGKRTKRPITPATVNRELACLKAMYFHALKDGHDFKNPLSKKMIGENAVKLLPENNEQDRVLTFEEQRKYLAAAGDTLKDVATLIVETGMRPEEVYRAKVENVHIEDGYLWNPYGKTKAARRKVPLNPAALAIITKRMNAAKGPYLFPHKLDKNKPTLKVNNAHDAALKKSKVRKFRLYDLRHTWATRAAESGEVDMSTLAALLGHSKLNMVQRYAHPQQEHQFDAVKKLAVVNAARQIAEIEKQKARTKSVPTISPAAAENPAVFEGSENEGKSQQIN